MTKFNPKLEGSNIIDCIPQKGFCSNRCQECYYNSGFFLDVNEDLPLMPTKKDVKNKIVRVNSGHDSNLDKDLVLRRTKKYKGKFYNTSILNFDFPAPVVYTCNRYTDRVFHKHDLLEIIEENDKFNTLMAIRLRTNTWNKILRDKVIDFFTIRNIPVILTFMRYNRYENCEDINNYQYQKHIINSYWCIQENAWNKIVDGYKHNPLVQVCGKTYGNSYCKDCNNCVVNYKMAIEKIKKRRKR